MISYHITTWCHNPEDQNLNLHCHENFNFHKYQLIFVSLLCVIYSSHAGVYHLWLDLSIRLFMKVLPTYMWADTLTLLSYAWDPLYAWKSTFVYEGTSYWHVYGENTNPHMAWSLLQPVLSEPLVLSPACFVWVSLAGMSELTTALVLCSGS